MVAAAKGSSPCKHIRALLGSEERVLARVFFSLGGRLLSESLWSQTFRDPAHLRLLSVRWCKTSPCLFFRKQSLLSFRMVRRSVLFAVSLFPWLGQELSEECNLLPDPVRTATFGEKRCCEHRCLSQASLYDSSMRVRSRFSHITSFCSRRRLLRPTTFRKVQLLAGSLCLSIACSPLAKV